MFDFDCMNSQGVEMAEVHGVTSRLHGVSHAKLGEMMNVLDRPIATRLVDG